MSARLKAPETATLAIEVAGLTIAVHAGSPDLAMARGESPFRHSATGRSDVSLRAEWRTLSAAVDGALVFDSGATWRLYRQGGQDVYRFFDPRIGPAPYKEAWIDETGQGALYLDPRAFGDAAIDPLEFPLDELLFLRLLAVRGGIELHACGVVAPDGRGYVFAGQSGDGKTTTARLWSAWPGARILSDDRIVLRHESGAWWMYGTPWHGEGEFALNARAPLSALFVLGRGENALDPLTAPQAVSALLARSFLPLHDAKAVAAALAVLDRAVADVGCRRYRFAPGGDAVRFILDAA